MKTELSNTDHVCLTADLWSAKTRSFLGVTAHWLQSDLSRKSVLLACRRKIGSATFEVLAQSLEEIMKEFGVQNKTVGCVTDSGSNFLKSFRLFAVEDR